MNYVQDKSLGEDIFQEVFIKLYLLNPQNVPNRGATSWLIHVIYNTAVTYLEKRSHQTEKGLFDSDSDFNQNTQALSIPSVEDEIISAIYVDELLRSFDSETTAILQLRHEGYTFEEISQSLSIPLKKFHKV